MTQSCCNAAWLRHDGCSVAAGGASLLQNRLCTSRNPLSQYVSMRGLGCRTRFTLQQARGTHLPLVSLDLDCQSCTPHMKEAQPARSSDLRNTAGKNFSENE